MLLFIHNVINCFLLVLEAFVSVNNLPVTEWIRFSVSSTLFAVGGSAWIVTSLPFGLNQMPDASSSSITSFIAWFVCSLFIGNWFNNVLKEIKESCFSELNFSLICALFSTIRMSIVVTSALLINRNRKWLIIEPKSSRSLKAIYHVLKFAAKHKAPINRSAFTYWEEDIPSRIDLGKSKYGGPFTTEQVEDVKTVLRLLVISTPLLFIAFSLNWNGNIQYEPVVSFPDLTNCTTKIVFLFTYSSSWCSILGVVANELIIYPLFWRMFPTILRRVGIASFTITLISFVCWIMKLVEFLSHWNTNSLEWAIRVLYYTTDGLLGQMLMILLFEFMSAQSPYNMRGLSGSFALPLVLLSGFASSNIDQYLSNAISGRPWSSLVLFSVKAVLCLIAFLLFCVVARWYKRRVRDEEYFTQKVVEEVYDRYLTAAARRSHTLYGATH